jgi:TatA/E family protein of Tat protein translocase
MGLENPVHLVFIGIVALLVLGPRRLPELARALGHGLREFREAMSMESREPPQPPAVQPAAAPPAVHPPVMPPAALPPQAAQAPSDLQPPVAQGPAGPQPPGA